LYIVFEKNKINFHI